jgi:tetratricopeptide (TPR) repeat protein
LAREIGDVSGESLATGNVGAILQDLGCLVEARQHFERCLALVRAIGDRRHEGWALSCLAEISAEECDPTTAMRHFAEAIEVRRSICARDDEAESRLRRGAFLLRSGRVDEARADLDAALTIARELMLPSIELSAAAHLALLPGADLAAARGALIAYEGRIDARTAMDARFLLFQATRDRAHLAEAKRLLDFMVEHAPPECRESMLTNVRLHREIVAACKEQGL